MAQIILLGYFNFVLFTMGQHCNNILSHTDFISRFSSCTFITPTSILDGLVRMKYFIVMDLEISTNTETQQATVSGPLKQLGASLEFTGPDDSAVAAPRLS